MAKSLRQEIDSVKRKIKCIQCSSSNEGGIYYQVSNSHIDYSKKMWKVGGMLSSFAGKPMITVPSYATNADALTDTNLLPSMLYVSQDNANVLKRK